jgi:hypothetical protein
MRLSAEEISAGWESVGKQSNVSPHSEFRMYSPLSEAADSFVRWAQSPQDRIHLGIPKIDEQLRGIINQLHNLKLSVEDQGHPADYVGVNIKKLKDGVIELSQ